MNFYYKNCILHDTTDNESRRLINYSHAMYCRYICSTCDTNKCNTMNLKLTKQDPRSAYAYVQCNIPKIMCIKLHHKEKVRAKTETLGLDLRQ